MNKTSPSRGISNSVSIRDEIMSADETAKLLGISVSTLYRWVNKGKITATKCGKGWIFRVSKVMKFVERYEKKSFEEKEEDAAYRLVRARS